MKSLLLIIAALVVSNPVQAAPDARSDDAVAVFGDLCVSLFSGAKPGELDPIRFVVTKIGDETARKIKPDLRGPLWDVSGAKSGVHLLVHYEPAAMCVVEVAEADEAELRAAFERLVMKTSTALGSTAVRQPDRKNPIEGKDATTSMWRIKASKGDVMLAATTYPDAKFMIQHLMTASYVR